MTAATDTPVVSPRQQSPAPSAGRFRSRTYVAVLLVIALLATGVMRAVVSDRRQKVIDPMGLRPRNTSRLAGLDTFALGLILGGLRGPLVMILWNNSENQKNAKNLESVDTQIELIRMLQPEFDSVHIFQIWNKAYNLSVQMASLPNKYATILDAVDYATDVDRERPHNVNLLFSLADLYANKLGDSAERRYYSRRIHRETFPHESASRLKRGDRGWRRFEHDVVLDDKGFILPQFMAPRVQIGNYTGADYQFLERYNNEEMGGFPYGLSPLAIGSNYYKRAAVLMKETGQRHLQVGDAVVDSRAAIFLRKWADEQLEMGRRREIRALGLKELDERRDIELTSAATAPGATFIADQAAARALVAEAIFEYRRAADVARHALEEYKRHIREQGGVSTDAALSSVNTYTSHIAEGEVIEALADADRAYLSLLAASAGFEPALVDPAEAPALRQEARRLYQQVADRAYAVLLTSFVEENVARIVFPAVTRQVLGEPLNRADMGRIDPKHYPALYAAVRQYYEVMEKQDKNVFDPYRWDQREFEGYIRRAEQRLALLR